MVIRIGGQIYRVREVESKAGAAKLGGLVKAKLSNVRGGRMWEPHFRPQERLEDLELERHSLAELQFRDQLLVFLIGALGTRRGEVGALRWMDCDFGSEAFYVQHSYYWKKGGHLKTTKTEASAKALPMHSALKAALLEWRSQSRYTQATDFVFPSLRKKGQKRLDLGAVLNRKIKPAFVKLGIVGVGWHTFRHTVGAMLADMGEHQLTIRDYLRHSHINVTNQYLQATSKSKRLAQEKLVDAILPAGSLSQSRSSLIQ